VHRGAIVEALWDGHPPDSAVKMVQAYVGRLRRQLDPGRPPQDRDGVLISAGTRYRLHAGVAQLDLISFEQLVGHAQAERRRGDLAAACEGYAQALSLWRGEPLADLDLLSAHPAVTGLARRRAEWSRRRGSFREIPARSSDVTGSVQRCGPSRTVRPRKR
jgi:hypothetical protein